MEHLQQRGAHVSYNDPYIPALPPMRHHTIRMESQPLTADLLAAQDCVVVVTDHSVYRFEWIAPQCKAIVDTRNATEGAEAGDCRIWKA
jgi:UDP-N-acetyl-D-glucosamine dehydrogenase